VLKNSGEEPCYFHNQALIKWKTCEEYPHIKFGCTALKDGDCMIEQVPCPTDKITEIIGLGRLKKASKHVDSQKPFRRR
jgi:hypothetical protein